MAKRWTSALAAAAAAPLIVALLGACGTTSNPAASPSTSAGKQTFTSFEEYQLAFAGCMREHGIAMADPSGGSVAFDNGGNMAAFTEASQKCRDQLGTPPAPENRGTPKSDEQLLAEHLKIAKCLREHGVNVPDPTADSDLAIPPNTAEDAVKTCAPNGVVGRASAGGK